MLLTPLHLLRLNVSPTRNEERLTAVTVPLINQVLALIPIDVAEERVPRPPSPRSKAIQQRSPHRACVTFNLHLFFLRIVRIIEGALVRRIEPHWGQIGIISEADSTNEINLVARVCTPLLKEAVNLLF